MIETPNSLLPVKKPVRLSAAAAMSLPRWGILLLSLLYILPGLIGRDPWKNADAIGFGVMWTMAEGSINDWFWPNVSGLPIPNSGPLTFWIGAICIKLFGWLLGAPMAARIATILFFLLGAVSIWKTANLLGQRADAQPMRLAFGGQPDTTAYGRMLADSALLIYLGSLGLLTHSHETSIEALFVALIAYVMYRCTRYINLPSVKNACMLGVASGFLMLTNGFVVPVGLYCCLVVGIFFIHPPRQRHFRNLAIAVVISAFIIAVWWAISSIVQPYGGSPFGNWLEWSAEQFTVPTVQSISFFFKKGIWFFWPAWPFACWAIYAWRRQWKTAAHILMPLLLTITFAILAFCSPLDDTGLLTFIPPLSVLAALGLPTMKRGAINAIDWFSVMALTVIALFIWVAWLARHTGWPTGIAKNAIKLAPGFTPEFSLAATVIAFCATLAWFAVVYWRISRKPSVLMRAVVLSSGGVMLCWILLATLWMPWINYSKSYAGIAVEMAQKMPEKMSCVSSNTSAAQRASFAFFGQVHFEKFGGESCPYLLIKDSVPKRHRPKAPERYEGKKLIWEGHRPSDREERFRLYYSGKKQK